MSDNAQKCCPITGCPVKQVMFATIAAFATIFAFDFIFHGIYMKPAYEATADLWRDEAAMQANFHFMTIGQALRAIGFAAIFCWICKGCGKSCIGTGIKIGLFLGIIVGACSISSYAYMPIPLSLPIKWFIGEVLQGISVGIVLSFICSKCSSACNKG